MAALGGGTIGVSGAIGTGSGAFATDGLADVLLGSLGITGVLTLLAVLLGVVMAGVLFWIRSRNPLR